MLRLPIRLRRYRVFLLCAIVMAVALVRLSRSGRWDYTVVQSFEFSHSAFRDDAKPLEQYRPDSKPDPQPAANPLKAAPAAVPTTSSTKEDTNPNLAASAAAPPLPTLNGTPTTGAATIPQGLIPDRKPNKNIGLYDDDDGMEHIHPVAPPGRQEYPIFPDVQTTIHWERQKEHFPVPTAELIQLPTGRPIKMPRIQHAFTDETTDAKINREKRQSIIKKEFQRTWTGYQKLAWLRDELSPVSGKFRDPFCGWAATLVDSLDTLWIMGLKTEFEEAADAVDSIDFTTTPRADIPMFETTIRYLGGLLAAYDVSEGQYPNLLKKAVELAEVMMGAFDTPNRMPVLYYQWKPAFASQPHRASMRSNLAELGSLSMEFTRLAQLTKEPKYYDAVARITNALSEWQDSGTKLDGAFPENVDASGCNRSVPVSLPVAMSVEDQKKIYPPKPPIGYVPSMPRTVPEPKPKKKLSSLGPGNLALQVVPGEPGKAQILDWEPGKFENKQKRDLDASEPPKSRGDVNQTALPARQIPAADQTPTTPVTDRTVESKSTESDGCVPQGLTSADGTVGWDRFSMGGGQDSTYEYFTKQHLLLGGLEEKYAKMYKKTANAIRKWMLYRPMLPNNRDVLFSGSVMTSGSPETDLKLTAEVTHLTCFIGGMMGMGAKIFDLEGDLEIAKKLTDGCVWAYEATTSGIMPERFTSLACESVTSCPWNETAYYLALDPAGPQRDKNVKDYLATKALRDAEGEAARLAAVQATDSPTGQASPMSTDAVKQDSGLEPEDGIKSSPGVAKRDRLSSSDYKQRLEDTKAELENGPAGFQAKPSPSTAAKTTPDTLPDPNRPLSHIEYVEGRIRREELPAGYVSVESAKYILRPEAIESVWYMYRITGDPIWQEKGWKMWESIIKATSAPYGHSAIFDVLVKHTQQTDEMESFWLAETLKYFYLLYSTPSTISLDDWVLNTEAHPFKRPM